MGLLDPPLLARAEASTTYGRNHWRVPPYLSENNDFRQIPVVMLHQFANSSDALGRLKNFLAWGYTPIFYSQLHDYLITGDASGLPAKPVVLTDDDGGASVYTYLFPNLQTLGIKCSLFVVPDWIDGTITAPPNGGTFQEASAVTWANLQEMQSSGLVEIHSHTKAHGSMRLLSGPAEFNGSGEGAGADYLAAKARIEQMIPGAQVRFNAAPYGVINETAIASLKAAGCEGNRITQCGVSHDGIYDGTGPTAFTYPWTDPFRVPIADDGGFVHLKRHNMYGVADVDGNRIQNGLFTQTQRGWTLPTGWTQPTVTLPSGANPSSGTVLQGLGTGAATGAYHTDMIPVGYYSPFFVDWWMQTTSAPAASCRLALDCFVRPDDVTPVKTVTESSPLGGTTSWTNRYYRGVADGTYAWVRPRFEIVGATASSQVRVWNVRLRCSRSEFEF